MKYNILIAEDEDDIRELLHEHLLNENFSVVEAVDGFDTIKKFYDNNVDLILLDIMMPGLDGYEVLNKIRETSTIPIIFLTAKDCDEDKISGLNLGADDYVCKPFSLGEISSRINAQLRRYLHYTVEKKVSSLVNGKLELDLSKYTLTKDGEDISLNPKEFGIMKLFMQNIDTVFTKKQLYEEIWNDNYYGDNNTIMVHISHLRDKIEDDPKSPVYLKTVRGIGYRMEKIHG